MASLVRQDLIKTLPTQDDLLALPRRKALKMLPQLYHAVVIMAAKYIVRREFQVALELIEYAVDAREIADQLHGRTDPGHTRAIMNLLEEIRSLCAVIVTKSDNVYVFASGQLVGEALSNGIYVPENMHPKGWTYTQYRIDNAAYIARDELRRGITA